MSVYKLSKENRRLVGEITLAGSKSISNRVLIIQALAKQNFKIDRLANANDTTTLERLLSNLGESIWDAHDGGTTFRFLTSYATTLDDDHILTGSKRMLERPIGILVEALRQLGANIDYLGREGYPPLNILASSTTLHGGKLTISSSVSSQFISALLMIAPYLDQGIELHLEGTIVSKPYIQMTLSLMAEFGIDYDWDMITNTIKIAPQFYQAPKHYVVEADWSAASYYYAMAVLAEEVDLQINGLFEESIQGDAKLAEMMRFFGIRSIFNEKGVHLQKVKLPLTPFEYNFVDCPDLAQTLVALCAGLNIEGTFSGLQTLKIKETDRIIALKNELKKFGSELECSEDSIILRNGIRTCPSNILVETYKDHRMAMAFAPLALLGKTVCFDSKEVVNKSYPAFWEDLEYLGFMFEKKEGKAKVKKV
ncbi:MAG: 3-phosphoshikimate 1-carboxyvinyltransferase [Saprospiraceae bacterium]|nr:3-phosphoshikimate 1-carboxyvinyltransferase [Saprospiraceae bacterium]